MYSIFQDDLTTELYHGTMNGGVEWLEQHTATNGDWGCEYFALVHTANNRMRVVATFGYDDYIGCNWRWFAAA